MADMRIERAAGHRQAYEEAKKVLLATAEPICGICGRPIDMSLKYPHPLSVSVDHILPLAKIPPGQEYLAWDISNLQLAHRCCNRAKSDKIIQEQTHHVLEETISNRVLPQSMDWTSYKPSQE